MNKQVKNPFKKAGQGGNKRFLINAAILAAGCLLVIFRMQTWGTVVSLCLLKSLKLIPELVRSICWSCKEALVSIIRCVVFLDEISCIDFFLPDSTFKSFPFFKLFHFENSSISFGLKLL